MYRYIAKFDHLGSMNGLCYIQNRDVMNRLIKLSRCTLNMYTTMMIEI